jgi:hypothetical protein
MQRAAASASSRKPLKSSPLPASHPQDLGQQSAKRQKFNASEPQSPDLNVSTPHSFSGVDDPGTPMTQQSTRSFTPYNYGGNEAESPWVLNTARNTDVEVIPDSPIQDAWLQEEVIGRRTFGNFKKKSTEKAPTPKRGKEKCGSLSPGNSDEDHEQYSEKMHGAMMQNGGKSKGKRRNDQDGERMDKINLKKLKSGGLSASSGMRQPGFGGKKNSRGKRKG